MTDLNEGMIRRSSSFSLPVSKSSDNLTEHAIFFCFLGGVNSLFLGVGCGVGTALCGVSIDIFGAVKSFRFFAIGISLLIVLFTISQIPTTLNFFRFSFQRKRGEI